MSQEGKKKVKPIDVTGKEVDIWRKKIFDYLKNERNVRDPLINASYIVNKALQGWATAPMSFEKRIERLLGINIKNSKKWAEDYPLEKYEDDIDNKHMMESFVEEKPQVVYKDLSVKEKEQLDEAKEREKIIKELETCNIPGMTKGGYVGGSIYQILNLNELRYWIEREKKYRMDFELNESSDEPLLKEVLIDELVIHRVILQRVQDPTRVMATEDTMQNCHKRIKEALESLNATRKQRESGDIGNKGNIAQLSLIYEEKIKNIAELESKNKAEEERMMELNAIKSPVNIIDDKEEDVAVKE